MPRNYQRHTDRQKWPEENMANAIIHVMNGISGYKTASTSFNVPKSTLQERMNKYKNSFSLQEASKKGMGNFKIVFTIQQEI